jgi:hypothetical protein
MIENSNKNNSDNGKDSNYRVVYLLGARKYFGIGEVFEHFFHFFDGFALFLSHRIFPPTTIK